LDTITYIKLAVIEDDPECREIIRRIMSNTPFEMLFYENARSFLAQSATIDEALLLIDYNLPDMTAKDLLGELHVLRNDLPFIVMTAFPDPKAAVEMMKMGAYDYIIKENNLVDILPGIINSSVDRYFSDKRHRAAEIELKRNEQNFRSIIENASDGIFIFDGPGRCIDVNETGCSMLGYTKTEMMKKHITELIPDEDLTEIIKEIIYTENDQFRNKDSYIKERRMKKKDGSYFYVEVSTKVMSNYTIGLVRDITLRKKNEELVSNINKELEKLVFDRTSQLEQTMNELRGEIEVRKRMESELIKAKDEINKAYEVERQLNFLKTRFINMISHEYRTPLTIINTSTYLLDKTLENNQLEKSRIHLDKIQIAVRTMTKLLEDVLTIDQIEKNKGKVYLEEFDAVNLTNRIFEEMNFDRELIDFTYEPDILPVRSNISLFTYIMQNLLSNSIKFSNKKEKVRLSIDVHDRQCKIRFEDKGIGIPTDENNLKLFEPFHRGNNVNTTSGTGLGLTIVKKAVESLNGSIRINSIMNEGTTVVVEFPV